MSLNMKMIQWKNGIKQNRFGVFVCFSVSKWSLLYLTLSWGRTGMEASLWVGVVLSFFWCLDEIEQLLMYLSWAFARESKLLFKFLLFFICVCQCSRDPDFCSSKSDLYMKRQNKQATVNMERAHHQAVLWVPRSFSMLLSPLYF